MINQDSKKSFNDIVAQLITAYKPEKIILFGSGAKGVRNADSDYDFFLIKRDIPPKGVDRIRDLLRKVRYTTASDFVIYTPEETEKRLQLGDPLIVDIVKNGQVIYG